MINITKKPQESAKEKPKEGTCNECTCQFTYENSDIVRDFRDPNDRGFVRCPHCRTVLYENRLTGVLKSNRW